MKVLMASTVNPAITVLDTAHMSDEPGVIGKFTKAVLKPVIQVQNDDGSVLYGTGDFGEPVLLYALMGIGTVIALAYILSRR